MSTYETKPRLYFAIHKHMHQPYYRAADSSFWNGELEAIFGSRCGNYTGFIPDAINNYLKGDLPYAGISTSWSGSLIEQLNRCEKENLCGGCFNNWNNSLKQTASVLSKGQHRRLMFTSFGFYHPIMSLIPKRDIIKQIALHRDIIKHTFGVDVSSILFPPEAAFHVRMVPALREAGITAVIYDSIHRYRSCKDYPYSGPTEGLLPPNPADQQNPPSKDWIQLSNIWAGSKISPSLLKPEYVKYEDVDGKVYSLIGIPAERYIGNEDGRGGFGALQYQDVLTQVLDCIIRFDSFDPAHPPFFVLHSDGDNHGGGADSYYHHNTERLVDWIKGDPRFELTTTEDYLVRFPPDPSKMVHIEPGAWSGADNGDPQFKKWFSYSENSYSPDLNSWAVLTALQNSIHSLEDSNLRVESFERAQRLLLNAETSCYWYWTGQQVWDQQVTEAANAAYNLISSSINTLVNANNESTGPTIFPPWITPENPGGLTWGQGSLKEADKKGTVHTFVYDISGLSSVELVLRSSGGEKRMAMNSHGAYPSRTNPMITADYFTLELPPSLGDVRYYIEATDKRGNRSFSTLERIFLGP